MNTNTAIGIVVALVVVLGAGYYTTRGIPDYEKNGVLGLGAPNEGETAQAGKVSGSFAELAMRSGSWKCTVDASTAQSISAGTTYVSGGKVRGDFTTTVQGYGKMESHIVADGEYVYTWSSAMPQGIKMKMTAQGTGGTATSGKGMDANQSYSYDCQPWVADASLLVPPASVSFMLLGQ